MPSEIHLGSLLRTLRFSAQEETDQVEPSNS